MSQIPSSGERSECKVDVHKKPTIKLDDKDRTQKVNKDDTVTLHGVIDGSPLPDIRVTFKGETLSAAKARIQIEDDGKFTITLPKVKGESAGQYQIEASNPHGTSSDTLDLNVRDVPGPVKNLQVKEVDRNEVSLAWQEPDRDGGCPLTGFGFLNIIF